MAYYCAFHEGEETPQARRVMLDTESGDVIAACTTHMLNLTMGMIPSIVGPENLVEFLTTWLSSLIPLPEPNEDSAEASANGTAAPKSKPRARRGPRPTTDPETVTTGKAADD